MTFDWFNFWADLTPQKVACFTVDDNQSYTYAEINKNANQVAAYFQQSFDLKKGDRICILSENCIENLILFSVAQKIGIVLIPLNFRLTKHEIDKLIFDAKPSVVLYQESFSNLLPAQNDVFHIIKIESLTNKSLNGNATFIHQEVEIDDAIFILYTSGSSGFPKGAIYTHKMLFWNSLNTSVSLYISNQTVTLNVMPPFHTGGWNVLVTPVLHHGGSVVLLKKFSAYEVLSYLESHKCNQFMAVPTMLKMLADNDYFESSNLSSLPYIIVGGEAMPLNLIKQYNEKGIAIRQGYGMTEVGPNLTSLHENDVLDNLSSIGKPNMYIKVKLLNSDGEEVGVGERGELCFSGSCVTPGYWNNSKATDTAFRNGWFCSGDIAIKDENGFLFIVDRIKNMYISGGENVYPAEIEKVLLADDRISEAVVIGVADDKWGEVGKAFLVLKNENVEVEELQKMLRNSLSKFKIPKHFAFVDSIPKLSNGKIDRNFFKENSTQ